jgi:hypothetical protein
MLRVAGKEVARYCVEHDILEKFLEANAANALEVMNVFVD